MTQMVKNSLVMQETWVRSLGREDPLEKGMATRFSILVWRIPAGRGAWWLQSMESDTTEQATLPWHEPSFFLVAAWETFNRG